MAFCRIALPVFAYYFQWVLPYPSGPYNYASDMMSINRLTKRLISPLWCILSFFFTITAFAQVNEQTCLASFDQAEDQIANGFFEEAIASLEPCREVNIQDPVAHALGFKRLADAYLAIQSLSQAREAMSRMLDLNPNFEPDVNLDTQRFRDMLAELRAERVQPIPPNDFTATVEDDGIQLSWTIVDQGNVSHIRILRGESSSTLVALDSVSAAASGYTDFRAEAGIEYSYALQAVGANGVDSELTDAVQASLPQEDLAVSLPDDVDAMPAGNAQKSPPSWRKWAFIGGGLVAGGVVAAVTLGGGGGGDNPDPVNPDPLPGPPVIP